MDLNKKNLAGGIAYEHDDPRERLRMVVINNLLEDTYYESDVESLEKIVERFDDTVKAGHAEFPLQLAAWARQEAGVRDVPQVLLVLAANWPPDSNSPKDYVREYAPRIIDRADELSTVLAFNNLYQTGRPGAVERDGELVWEATIPHVLKAALRDVLESGKFDTYQLAKYTQEDRAVSLHDVLNVVHPDPPDRRTAAAFERITKGRRDNYDVRPLTQRRTWEDVISDAGPDVTSEDWRGVLDDMGLFARVRNVRNMIEAGLDGEEIFADVTDDWILNSKLYPFRFYQAWKAVDDTHARAFLEHAIDVSTGSVPDDLRNTVSIVDVSGSMRKTVSNRSTLSRDEIAALFGAVLTDNGAATVAFADQTKWIYPDDASVLELQNRILSADVGSSTFAHRALAEIDAETTDRVVIFTDFQIWERGRFGNDPNAFRGAWEKLTESHPETPTLYIVDLASYGEIKLPPDYPNVRRLQGWSGKVLDYIWYNEQMLDDIIASGAGESGAGDE